MNNINIDKIIETITYWVTTYSVKLLAAILIFIIGKWLAGKISRLITNLLKKNNVDITLINFLESIIYYTFLIVVIIATAGQLGINTTSFLTIVGAAGLAIGLALKEDDRVLDKPESTIAVSELADSSVNFVVRPWVKTPDYWGTYFRLTEKIKIAFDEEGISIPYPQQDVHMFNEPAQGK